MTAGGRSPHKIVEAQLGHGFGKRVTIEARVVARNNPVMRRVPEICLHVLSNAGAPAPADLILSFSCADLVPEDIAPDDKEDRGHHQPLITGRLYRLRGYETGEWIGVPAELMGRFPSLDPPNERPFQFHSWFRVEVGAEIQGFGEQVAEERLGAVRFW